MNLWNTDEIDYEALGFRCGIEIHQQLDTKTKLFCHCPVGLVDDRLDARLLRHMRPTLSEMGEYDGTALMEKKTRKEIIYEILNDRVCTYEMDDTPPFLINQKAIDIGITLSLLFQCSIVDEAHIARKQYLDGSIPTGFQRTTVLGTDGWVPYKNRRIRVRQVNVEEDSCREVSDKGHRIVFRTDRLSIPLVEVITDPEMLDPIEAGEVTMLLAETNRISGLVRRGIGTARQDVNVSITGGSRVEIKGVEKIRYIPLLTHFEALR
ncbi:MAG: Glu-tRNA(Gln) amidotransferase GatDE subunit E, partial [candidate division Zixibacteria bacterium]|nr:Glu-tRNA(Gln) amidotransferase GatDE subunit E [candidate division Zixibacteria bacterium]